MKAIRLAMFTHRFTLTGLNLERFMNTMQKAGIPLLSVRRVDQRTLKCECFSADLSAISEITAEKGWRLTDAQPAQLSAFFSSLKARPGIPIGILLSIIMLVAALQFVWRIEIHDAGAYRADIASFLAQAGLTPGTRRSDVDAAALERALTRRYPDIAWFHVYVYNITLVVDVSQGVAMPELPIALPDDVVATCGGIVRSVEVFSGTAQVKAGDIVRKGQILISGVERAADEQFTPVQARGVVMARCWRSTTVEMPLVDIQSAETGRESHATQLCTPFFSYPAELERPDFLASNTYLTLTPVVGSFFPVYRKEAVFREVSMEYALRDGNAVKEEAGNAALRKLKTALYGYEIIDKWVDYCMIEGTTLAATATAEWLMDIGGKPPD